MTFDVVEEYDRLTRPDFYQVADRAWMQDGDVQASLARFQSASAGGTDERIRQARRTRTRKNLERFDDSILKAIDWTLDDLVDAFIRRQSERRAGRMVPQAPDRQSQRRNALLALREADQAGQSWGQAIEAAQSASTLADGREIDRKTIDRWMREIHGWGLLSMSAPAARRRGRPKKKE